MAMIIRQGNLLDQNNRPISGAAITVYNQDGSIATLTSDGTTALANPGGVVSDSFGNYKYYANTGVYTEDIHLGTARIWEQVIAIGTGADVSTLAALAASGGSALVGQIATGTGAVARTVQAKERDIVSVSDFSSHAIADASGNTLLVPANVSSTRANGAAVVSNHWGFGQVTTADNNKRGKFFSSVQSAPSSLGNHNNADTAFNGDLSHSIFQVEHRITGTATLSQPTSGYVYTPEAYPFYGVLYNSSGWNQATGGNGGRTGAAFFRVNVQQYGQGDAVAFNATAFVTGAKAGATHFLANPAAVLFNGDMAAGQSGVYENPLEFALNDNGFDIAAVGTVINLNRTVNTGALGVWWAGHRVQSIGTVPIDAAFSASGLINYGLDFTPSTFGINKCAIALKSADRIYGNASTTDPNLLKPTSLGTDWIERTANGWSLVYNNVACFIARDTGIGYQTGTGGAVTQSTSRTTGVTLNKACGQITLVSAAGSVTWQTFTVTNSAVVATDVVHLSQASGTDKYMLHVTGVRAGAFDVSFATTGGTTTEQPVFNFAVLKAVAA